MSEYEGETWIEWFCGQLGNEYLCEVDSAFIGKTSNDHFAHSKLDRGGLTRRSLRSMSVPYLIMRGLDSCANSIACM